MCNKNVNSLTGHFYFTSVSYRYLNLTDKALNTLDQLIQADPNYGRAYQELGHIHFKLDNKDKALKAYLRAVNTIHLFKLHG